MSPVATPSRSGPGRLRPRDFARSRDGLDRGVVPGRAHARGARRVGVGEHAKELHRDGRRARGARDPPLVETVPRWGTHPRPRPGRRVRGARPRGRRPGVARSVVEPVPASTQSITRPYCSSPRQPSAANDAGSMMPLESEDATNWPRETAPANSAIAPKAID